MNTDDSTTGSREPERKEKREEVLGPQRFLAEVLRMAAEKRQPDLKRAAPSHGAGTSGARQRLSLHLPPEDDPRAECGAPAAARLASGPTAALAEYDAREAPSDEAGSYPIDWSAKDIDADRHSRSTQHDEAHMRTTTEKQTAPDPAVRQLWDRYEAMVRGRRVGGRHGYHLKHLLGIGGQGMVFVTKRGGADGFGFEAALKLFSPDGYSSVTKYEAAMRRIARVASIVALARHPNLVDVLYFEQCAGIRVMLMERVDGYDLRRLVKPGIHCQLQETAPADVWKTINGDVVTFGDEQLRMQPGFAVTVVRDCLNGLIFLHSMGIVHGDVKPSNIMLTRVGGHAKLVDLGSAFDVNDRHRQRFFTPTYAAPEVLERREWTPLSDLASLGYVLVELLCGRRLFSRSRTKATTHRCDDADVEELVRQKRELPSRLEEILPPQVVKSHELVELCKRLIHPDPKNRFPSAEKAYEHPEYGANAFLNQLVCCNLATCYDKWIRLWIEQLR